MNHNLLPLNQLKEGRKVKVKEIKDIYVKNQLNQLGITLEQEVLITKISAFGSPIALKSADTEIAIRKDVAELIFVEPIQ